MGKRKAQCNPEKNASTPGTSEYALFFFLIIVLYVHSAVESTSLAAMGLGIGEVDLAIIAVLC